MNQLPCCCTALAILIGCSDQVQSLNQVCTLDSLDRVDRGFEQQGDEWSRVLPVHTEGCGAYGARLMLSENFVDSSAAIEICNLCDEPRRLNWFVELSATSPPYEDLQQLLTGLHLLFEAVDGRDTEYMVGCTAPLYTDRQERVYQPAHLILEPNKGFVASLPFNPVDLAYVPAPEAGVDFAGLELSSEMRGRLMWPRLVDEKSDRPAAHPLAICADLGFTAYLEHRVTSWTGAQAGELFASQDLGPLDFPEELRHELQNAR